MKRRGLERIAGGVPWNLNLVPVDFEVDYLDDALIAAGFDPKAPAFFSWLGVTCYLTEEAIAATVDQIAARLSPRKAAWWSTTATPGAWCRLTARRWSSRWTDSWSVGENRPMLSVFSPEEIG